MTLEAVAQVAAGLAQVSSATRLHAMRLPEDAAVPDTGKLLVEAFVADEQMQESTTPPLSLKACRRAATAASTANPISDQGGGRHRLRSLGWLQQAALRRAARRTEQAYQGPGRDTIQLGVVAAHDRRQGERPDARALARLDGARHTVEATARSVLPPATYPMSA